MVLQQCLACNSLVSETSFGQHLNSCISKWKFCAVYVNISTRLKNYFPWWIRNLSHYWKITCLFCCFEFYIYHVELENISLNYRYIRVNDFFSLDVIECKTTFFRMTFLKEIGWHIGCSIRYSAVHGFRVHIWTTNLSVFFVLCVFKRL